MICQKCGENNPVGQRFCQKCGSPLDTVRQKQAAAAAPVSDEPVREEAAEPISVPAEPEPPQGDSLRDFYRQGWDKIDSTVLRGGAVLCWAAAIFMLLDLLGGQWLALPNLLVTLGLSLWLWFRPHKPAAWVLAIYSLLSTVYYLLTQGQLGYWLGLFGALLLLAGCSGLDSAWRRWKSSRK